MRRGDRQLFEDGHPQHLLAKRVCRQTEIAYHSHQIPGDETMTKFTEKFSSDPTRNIQWKKKKKKIRRKEPIPFPVVMQCIKDNLQEFWKEDL